MARADLPTLLVVEHQADCGPGWLGEWLTAAGLALDIRRPYAGDPLPSSATERAGLLVLGGSPGAYDDERAPWLPTVRALLRDAVAAQVPTLGVCLGHQLLSVACGGSVARDPRGKRAGVNRLGHTPEAATDPLLGDVPAGAPAVSWNDDSVTTLPADTTVLAADPDGVPQAIRVGARAWGVQFHPEVGFAAVRGWAAQDVADGYDPTSAAQHLEAIEAAEPQLRATWRGFADRFAAQVHPA